MKSYQEGESRTLESAVNRGDKKAEMKLKGKVETTWFEEENKNNQQCFHKWETVL
jgi:hypothetical protein